MWSRGSGIRPRWSRANGSRDLANLNGLLNLPLAVLPPGTTLGKPVWHCVLRAAPEDPELPDDDWAAIAHEVMDHVGLARYGDDDGVRWVAVRHADDHVHVVATLAREDGRKPRLSNDFYRVREACNGVERRYGLRSTAPGDRTAAKRPTRAETEQTRRQRRSEEPRVTLRRQVATVAAMADSEAAFFSQLRADGLLVRERFSRRDPGEVTGYAVALLGHVNRQGRPVWFGGGRLAADLTLPKLRHRWTGMAAAPEHTAVERNAAWSEAIVVSRQATERLRSCGVGSPVAADIAWATADVLRVTARKLGGGPKRLLHCAADAYDRAARVPYARIPASTAGNGLRAVARILAKTSNEDDRITRAIATLLHRLAELADAITRLRIVERRTAGAVAAAECASRLCDAHERLVERSERSAGPEHVRITAVEPEQTQAGPVAVAARDFPDLPVVGDARFQQAPDPVPVRWSDPPRRSRR